MVTGRFKAGLYISPPTLLIMSKVMKTLVLLALLLPGAMNAQRGFKFGVKAGVNLTTMPTTDLRFLEYENGIVKKNKFKAGGHLGATMNLGFGRHGNSSLTADLLFSVKGGAYRYDDYDAVGSDTVATKIDVNESVTRLAIELPVLYRYRLNMGLYGEAGIFISAAPATIFTTDDPRYDDTAINYEEKQYKMLDIGLTGGVGWIGKGGFGAGVRGFMGFLDQYDTYTGALVYSFTIPTGRTVNTGAMLSGMYYFGWASKRRR